MTYFLYFSPTGGTSKYINAIAPLSSDYELHNLTLKRDPLSLRLTPSDLLVLAYPVYYGRIPPLVLEKLNDLKGERTPAILLGVYGNRHYNDALKEGADFLEMKGFVPYAAAGLVAKHTYGNIQVNRPDQGDLLQLKEFFRQAMEKEEKVKRGFPGNVPYKEIGKPHFYPFTNDDCIACGACQRACAWKAIDEEYQTIQERCSACLACIPVCPMDARILPEAYNDFAEAFSEKLKEPRENEFFL